MKKKSVEIIFTFKDRCRYWLRFPGLKEKKLNDQIKKLQSKRADGSELITKPMLNDSGEQSELTVIDVFATPSGYEYKFGKIAVAEDSVFFK